MKFKTLKRISSFLLLSWLLAACSILPANEPTWLVLLTTQELEDSGLLNQLIPQYEQLSGVRVKRLPLSTTTALDYAKLAGVDVVLLPAGPALDSLAGPIPTWPPFQREPFPTPTVASQAAPDAPPLTLYDLYYERRVAFWSELVIVVPPNDPLGLGKVSTATGCLKAIALSHSKFYMSSQAFEPGLYDTAERLWDLIGRSDLPSRGTGYQSLNLDAAAMLKQAAKDQAYTMVSFATFFNTSENIKNQLEIGYFGDRALFVPYEIAIPNNVVTQDRNVKLARSFVSFLTNQTSQTTITQYNKPPFPNPPFRPYYYPVYIPPKN